MLPGRSSSTCSFIRKNYRYFSTAKAFSVMLPGLWLMALSPLPLVLAPGVASAAAWVTLLSVGEIVWAPRQSAWTATLAPPGREGIFLALLSLGKEKDRRSRTVTEPVPVVLALLFLREGK